MTTRTAAAVLVLVVVLAGIAGQVPLAAAVAGVDGGGVGVTSASATTPTTTATEARPTEITDCTAITEPGTYVLTGDVTNGSATDPRSGLGACVAIRASDVTLRGRDHTLSGGEAGRPGVVGVLVGGGESVSNVTVRNLTVTRWGAGIAVFAAEDATIRNVSVVGNLGDGVFAENARNLTIRGGVVSGSNTGAFLRNVSGARIADLTVVENLAGVSVRSSTDVTVAGVNASRNDRYGVGAFASTGVAVSNATLAGNGFAGVVLSQTDAARLRNLTVTSPATPGGGAGDGGSAGSDPVGVYLNDSRARLVGVRVADAPGWAVYATGNSTADGERVRLGETVLSFSVSDVALDSADEPVPDSTDGPPPLPAGSRVVGQPLLVAPTGGGANLSLTVRYADAAVERADTTGEALSLWRVPADGGNWTRVPATVRADRNAVRATLGNLSENGTFVALVGEGLAEAGNGTSAGWETETPTREGTKTE